MLDASTTREVIPFWRGRTHARPDLRGSCPRSGTRPTRPASSPSSWSSARPATPCSTARSTPRACSTSRPTSPRAIAALDFVSDPEACDRREQLAAMRIACDAVILLRRAPRRAGRASWPAASADPARARRAARASPPSAAACPAHAPARLSTRRCRRTGSAPRRSITELNGWDSINPGHLDQHLLPFYRRDLADGTLTRESAHASCSSASGSSSTTTRRRPRSA